jgi:geranylgeranyl diphosphate synthase type 3
VSDAPRQPPSHLDAYLDPSNPIFEPLVYACSQKGKAHRLKYMMAVNEWLQTPEPIFHHLVEVLQVCHTASLMIDDIMDRTDLRRGEPTAHRRFGTARTLGAAYTGVLQALLSVYTHAGPGCLALAVEESARLHQGQTEELYFRDTATCPTEEQYLRMVENKTGGPFRLATRLLVALAPSEPTPGATTRLLELSRLVGIFFQIRDDHLDLTSEAYVQKKGVLGSDLDEGKYSFPLVRSIAQRPEMKRRVDALFAAQPISDADRQALIDELHADGSLAYSRHSLRQVADDIAGLVKQLAGDFGRPGDGMARWMDELIREIPAWDDTDTSTRAATS